MAGQLTTLAKYSATLDDSGFQRGVERMKQSSREASAAVDKITESTQRAGRNASASADGFQRFFASIDQNVARAQQYQRDLEKLNRFQQAGVVSANEYAVAQDAIRRKYADLTGPQNTATTGMERFQGAVALGTRILGAFGIVLTGTALVQGFMNFGRNVMNVASNLQEQAAQVGVTTEALQAYRGVMEITGGRAEQMDRVLARLNDRLGAALEGAGSARDAFAKLGFTLEELGGGPEAVLPRLAQHAMRVGDEQKRVAAINDILGERLGRFLIPGLEKYAAGYGAVASEAKKAGLVIDDEFLKRADDAADKMNESRRKMETAWAPFFIWWNEQWAKAGENVARQMELWERVSQLGGRNAAEFLQRNRAAGAGIPLAPWNETGTSGGSVDAATNWQIWSRSPARKGGGGTPLVTQEEVTAALQLQQDYQAAVRDTMADTTRFLNAEIQKRFDFEEEKRERGIKAQEERDALQRERNKRSTAEHIANLDKIEEANERSANSALRYWQEVGRSITDSFRGFFDDIFIDGEVSFGNLFNSIKRSFGQMLSDMATQALMRPIILPMMQAFQGVAGGLGGSLALPGAVANSLGFLPTFGGASGLPTSVGALPGLSGIAGMGGIAGLGGLGGIGGALNAFGAAHLGLATGSTTVGGITLGSVNGAGLFGTGLGAATSLTGLLGAGALGALGGGMFSDLIGGTKIGGSIGGGIGATAGMLLGGPLGALLGGLAGSAIGGLFGNEEPSNYTAFANFGPDWSVGGGLKGDKPNSATLAAAAQAGQAISQAAKLLEAAGIELANNVVRLRIGQRDPSMLELPGRQFVNVGPVGDVEAAVKGTLNYLLQGATSSNATVQTVLSSWASRGGVSMENLDQIVSDIDFATQLENLSFVEEKLTQSEQLLKAISEQFEAAITRAQELGIETAKVEEARARAIAQLRDDFNDASQAAIDQMLNPTYAAWKALAEAQEERMKEAKALGADIALLERRGALERRDFLRSLNEEQRNALIGLVDLTQDLALRLADMQRSALVAVDEQIRAATSFGNEQRGIARGYEQASAGLAEARGAFLVGDLSTLGPIGQYQEARAQLEALKTRAMGGDVDALRELPGLSQTFLRHSLNVNAATSAYGQDFSYVQSVLDAAKAKSDTLGNVALSQVQLAEQQVALLQDIKTTLLDESPDAALLREQLAALDAIAARSAEMAAQIGLGLNVLDAPTLRSALLDLLRAIDPAASPTPVVVPTVPTVPDGTIPGGMTQPGVVEGPLLGGTIVDGTVQGGPFAGMPPPLGWTAAGMPITEVPADILAAFNGDQAAAVAWMASVGSANPQPFPTPNYGGVPQDVFDSFGGEQAYRDWVAAASAPLPDPAVADAIADVGATLNDVNESMQQLTRGIMGLFGSRAA